MDGWFEHGGNSSFQFHLDGRLLAEVFPTPSGRWNWYRLTTYMEHGVDPRAGTAESLEDAKRAALRNVKLPYTAAHLLLQ